MKTLHIVLLAVASAQASASNSTSQGDLNGWYQCYDYTFADEGPSPGQDAECAIYAAPLCYPGICETPANVESNKVDIFVKRLLATTGNPETASNVWLLQGGPGYSSTAMENSMVDLHQQLNGAVNVYTMDHRGTGRSTLFNCVAAQVTTTGTPWGDDLIASEVPTCARDLQFKYGGDFAAFSVTSAATDLTTFISKYTNGASTIVYGVSYGTMLVERLIHLAPPQVVGYVLDSVVSSSGAIPVYYSDWDKNFGEIGDDFFALCDEDKACKAHFATKKLNETVQDLLNQFDKNPNSTCATLISNVQSKGLDGLPSSSLKFTLGTLLKDTSMRTLIPPLVYRLNRCASKDLNVLKKFVTTLSSNVLGGSSEDEAYVSNILFYLIVFSEMWEIPTPSKSEMKERFINAKVSDDPTYPMDPVYCAFSKEKSTSCEEFGISNYDASPVMYEHDQYWNKSATIPSQASVLLLSGKLDPQAHHKYAEALLRAMDGDKKELISFKYTPHGIISSTQMATGSETCGTKLLVSYVKNGGDLEKMDKSCVAQMPGFNLNIPTNYLQGLMGTDDAYEGIYKPRTQ
ncbi:hypothetical protein V7S43_014518 [Phytophthora oleae]|uniref:AB hydrolase-1 domain-containing protein n=1 Tax=Phytophthora oleae TaxID=2107226 RepID=A0ABD3F2V1_9STRA